MSAGIDKMALYTPNALFHRNLGRLEKGYNIVSLEDAQEWLQVSDKVREASPHEVAAAFGV